MLQNKHYAPPGADISRRNFVKGLSLAGAMGLGGFGRHALASDAISQAPQVLRGTNFKLSIGETVVNLTGKPRRATTINGSLPAPTLRWKEGEIVTLSVTNTLNETTSIHWHGLILPNEMDGVPGLTYNGIAPGETFTYRFKVQQSGTYWYHSHSGFQEQTGLYGAIVIDPARAEPFDYDQDYTIVLSDWSDETPERIYAKLKKLSHYYNFNERTSKELFSEIKQTGVKSTWNNRAMWNQMRMSSRDLEDVTGYTYTYLMNGDTPDEGWKGLFKKGDKVRLRFVNAAAMSFFDVRIPGLKMKVVASDGQNIQPVTVDEFRIGVAETYDVIVEPSSEQAYTLFAQSIGRSGYARGTLTPDLSVLGEVPLMDEVPSLSHSDMGMDMSGMDHSNMAGMDHSSMPGMDHSMPEPAPSRPVTHAKTEFGPQVDMRAEAPQVRLNDPGVGLRNNGRRVLTYADMASLRLTRDRREPERELELHLTGNMGRYTWSINGINFADSEPLKMKYGERLRIRLVNDTMMNHPMHLHGLWSELETGDARHLAKKHTVVVQPGSQISYLVTADALGNWAYHCHLLYHMPGMFRKVVVA